MRTGRIFRLGALLMVLDVLMVDASSVSAAMLQTPDSNVGSPATVVELLDLPALVLRPSDIAEPGYGIGRSGFSSFADDASSFSSSLGGTIAATADVQARLTEAGWLQSYWLLLAIPTADGSGAAVFIETGLVQYADETGAGDGLALLNEANAASGYRKAIGAEPVGDESLATRKAGTTSGGAEYQELSVAFRVGIAVAELIVTDGTGQRPEIEIGMALATTVAERLAGATDAPGRWLSSRVLRLESAGVTTLYDQYRRLEGEEIRFWDEGESGFGRIDRANTRKGISTIYFLFQSAPSPISLRVNVYLNQFSAELDAVGAMEEWLGDPIDTSSGAYSDIVQVDEPAALGDETLAFSYTFARSSGDVVEGFEYIIRVGDIVLLAFIDAIAPVTQEAAETIFAAAAACLQAEAPCAPMALPESLQPAA